MSSKNRYEEVQWTWRVIQPALAMCWWRSSYKSDIFTHFRHFILWMKYCCVSNKISRVRTINPTYIQSSRIIPEKIFKLKVVMRSLILKAHLTLKHKYKNFFLTLSEKKFFVLYSLFLAVWVCKYTAVLCLFFSITSHLCTRIHWTLELTSSFYALSSLKISLSLSLLQWI